MSHSRSYDDDDDDNNRPNSSVVSLGWVPPGAATDGVTLIFFLKN